MTENLKKIERRLVELKKYARYKHDFYVPSLWINPKEEQSSPVKINPFDFFLAQLEKLTELAEGVEQLFVAHYDPKVYNMFIRHACAYDHDHDGKVESVAEQGKFRETGTFLKAIAMLPYIQSLGIDTVYVLPVTSIGLDGKKGTLGSPYAVRNPYKLDEMLAEPVLRMDSDLQFSSFVDAAHMLGMKVITEFVFRTASIDSDLALDHPNWFYWIRSIVKDRQQEIENERAYGSPVFTEEELILIKEKVLSGDFHNLPQPPKSYRDLFQPAPQKVAKVDNKIVGVNARGQELRIPGAFADWPPDDNQPPWSDVTYLRLFDHAEFNYIAYNTVRMYDSKLERARNRVEDLWKNIIEIIPNFQKRYNIDGVMIDMGHALPSDLRSEIVNKARVADENFIFWEENFTLTAKSLADGYNAAVGYLPFDEHIPDKMNKFIKLLAEEGSPIPFFCTTENHNTPRAAARFGGLDYSKLAWALNSILPGIPFIHAGFELGDVHPVNTGLDFTKDEIADYPPEKLPLFSEASLNWDSTDNLTEHIREFAKFREEYFGSFGLADNLRVHYVKSSLSEIVSFYRDTLDPETKLLFIGNISEKGPLYFEIKLPVEFTEIRILAEDRMVKPVNGSLIFFLYGFEYIIAEISAQSLTGE